MTVGDLIVNLQSAAAMFGDDTAVEIIQASGSIELEVAADRMDVQNIIVISGDRRTAVTLTAIRKQTG